MRRVIVPTIDKTTVESSTKRRKVVHVPSSSNVVNVKQELSPSPPPSLAPCTSGTKHIGLPLACRKTNADWKEQRIKWTTEETLKLKRLGFQVTKRLIRDDGLALDWVSPVPVDPLTLRAPLPEAQPIQVENITSPVSMPMNGSSIDTLGHALRDQSSLAGLSPNHTPNKASVPSIALRDTENRVSQSVTEENLTDPSNFVVVGAALLKRGRSPNHDHVHPPQHEPVQTEHRKLLPVGLRTPPTTTGNKEAQDWRARRKAWIAKEMEKVEGYTGGHARGFKYDGDDVIIYVQKRHNPAVNRRHSAKSVDGPPNVKKMQQEKNTIHGELSSQTRVNILPTAVSSKEDVLEDPGAYPNYRAVQSKQTDQLKPQDPTMVIDHTNTDPQRETSLPAPAGAGVAPDTTQARGLGFLEQYLQMYDNDRGSLGFAYTENATLSLRTEEGYSNLMNAPKVSSRSPTSGMIQVITSGPTAIVDILQKLDVHLHHSPLRDIEYNIAALDDLSADGLLLTCDGVMVHPDHPGQSSRWSFSRTFVLKQNEEEGRPLWPMKIVAEKLTIYRTTVL